MAASSLPKQSQEMALRFMTGAAFAALISVVVFVDPQHAGTAQILLFYVSLFVFFTGSAALFFRFIMSRFRRHPLTLAHALFWGALCSLLAIVAAFLQEQRVLTAVTFGGVVAAFVLILFLVKRMKYAKH